MSDIGGLAGALFLSEQISSDRLMDSYRRAREGSALSVNDAAWRNQYNDLINRYNALLAEVSRRCRNYDAEIEAMDGSLEALRGSVKIHEENEARLTAELARQKDRYASLLFIHKGWNPNYEPYED